MKKYVESEGRFYRFCERILANDTLPSDCELCELANKCDWAGHACNNARGYFRADDRIGIVRKTGPQSFKMFGRQVVFRPLLEMTCNGCVFQNVCPTLYLENDMTYPCEINNLPGGRFEFVD